MADIIRKVLDINTTGATKSIKNLKDEVSRLNSEIEELEVGSADYQKTLTQLVTAQNDLAKATESLRGSTQNTVKLLDNFGKVGSGITSGISSVSAAIGLLGGNSEDANKAMLKVQQTMQLVQGVSGLKGLGQGLSEGIRSFKALSTAVGGLGAEFSALLGPLGLALAALTAVAGALSKIKDNAKQKIQISTEISTTAASSAAADWTAQVKSDIAAINSDSNLTPVQKQAAIKAYKESIQSPSTLTTAQTAGGRTGAALAGTTISARQAASNAIAAAAGSSIISPAGGVGGAKAGQYIGWKTSPAWSKFITGSVTGNTQAAQTILEAAADAQKAGATGAVIGRSAGAAVGAALTGLAAYLGYKGTGAESFRSGDDIIAAVEEAREKEAQVKSRWGNIKPYSAVSAVQKLRTEGTTGADISQADRRLIYALAGGSGYEDALSTISGLQTRLSKVTKTPLKDLKFDKNVQANLSLYTDILSEDDLKLIESFTKLNEDTKDAILANVEVYDTVQQANSDIDDIITAGLKEAAGSKKQTSTVKSLKQLVADAKSDIERQLYDIIYFSDDSFEADYSEFDQRQASIDRLRQLRLLSRSTMRTNMPGYQRGLFGGLFDDQMTTADNAVRTAEFNLSQTQINRDAILEANKAEEQLLKDKFNNQLIEYEDYYLAVQTLRQQNADAEIELDNAKTEVIIANREREKAATENSISAWTTSLGIAQGLFSSMASMYDEDTKAYKNYQAAAIVASTAAAAMNAYASGSKISPYLGAAAAAAAVVEGGIQLRNLYANKIGSSNSSSYNAPELNFGSIDYTRNLLGDKETARLNQNTKVTLVYSDLENFGNKVTIRDSASTF